MITVNLQLRLSAAYETKVVYVMTHDSIGLGEDGPTHQPIEQLTGLRSIPNLNVFRPADLTETIECWELALKQLDTPSVLALSRQNLSPVGGFMKVKINVLWVHTRFIDQMIKLI